MRIGVLVSTLWHVRIMPTSIVLAPLAGFTAFATEVHTEACPYCPITEAGVIGNSNGAVSSLL